MPIHQQCRETGVAGRLSRQRLALITALRSILTCQREDLRGFVHGRPSD